MFDPPTLLHHTSWLSLPLALLFEYLNIRIRILSIYLCSHHGTDTRVHAQHRTHPFVESRVPGQALVLLNEPRHRDHCLLTADIR